MNSNNKPPLAYGRQAEIFPWGEGRILKLFKENWLDSVKNEFNISQLAYIQGVHTPKPLEIVMADGRPGIVFERVDGPSLLGLLGMRPWKVLILARQFAQLHQSIHRCNASTLPTARDELIKCIQSRQQLSESVKIALLDLLKNLPDGNSLLHGDFHPDNVMVPFSGMVIIDWPNAVKGYPLADVARTTIMLRIGEPLGRISFGLWILSRFLRGIFHTMYLQEYFRHSTFTKKELHSWEIILAAQRLGDRISGEENKLIRFIERGISH